MQNIHIIGIIYFYIYCKTNMDKRKLRVSLFPSLLILQITQAFTIYDMWVQSLIYHLNVYLCTSVYTAISMLFLMLVY